MSDRFKQLGSDIEMADLVYQGERNDVVDYLPARGWDVSTLPTREAHALNDFEFSDGEMSALLGDLTYVRAILTT